ncbi:AtzG-like protein [uncultured Pseudacidovorax sp.]|uniref:AtzG-like protein n=1 Tax=uncultured Pseudacidovorax sp. TaxID=679313 RepID=UPI0025F602BA|nr:AtzG-like protein [uncultured Pseudacidovorax sp.]
MNAQQIETYVDAAAAALDLPLAPEHRPGVLRYFALAADMAALTEAVELAPHDESALRFEPVAPGVQA